MTSLRAELGADLFGEVLGQVAAVVGCAVRVVEPHVVGDRVDARAAASSASGMESNASRTGWVVPAVIVSSRSSVPGVWVRDHEDRRPPQLGQGEAAVRVPLAQGADRDVDAAQHLTRREDVLVVAGDEIGCVDGAFGAVRRHSV